MPTYTLIFDGDGNGEAKRIDFHAEDASGALIIAHQEAPRRSAELWEGDQKLCTIRRDPVGDEDFWEVAD